MKIKLLLSAFSVFVFSGSTAFAQTAPNIVRSVACSVNDGYSISDAVEFGRNMEWTEETAPLGLFLREAVAVSGEFQNNWGFVISTFYADFSDMVAKRGAVRSRSGGRAGGTTLSDIMTCGPRARIALVNVANEGEIFDDTEATLMGSTVCQLNGATVAQAIGRAAAQGQSLNAYSAVDLRLFGGNSFTQNSQVSVRYVFPNATSFGVSLDAMRNSGGPAQIDDGITCNNGSLWLSHRIYAGSN